MMCKFIRTNLIDVAIYFSKYFSWNSKKFAHSIGRPSVKIAKCLLVRLNARVKFKSNQLVLAIKFTDFGHWGINILLCF